MFKNHIKISVKSHHANNLLIRDLIKSFMELESATLEEIADMRCAVSEAFDNAVDHAYSGSTDGWVEVELYSIDHAIHAIVRDSGCGIENIEWAREPGHSSNGNDENTGMGFTVMSAFVDVVDVASEKDKGTTIHLTKNLS